MEKKLQHHSKDKDKDILCFRHARSQFNQGEEAFYKNQSYLSWAEKAKNGNYRAAVLYNPKYIDAPLSRKGIEQCKKASHDDSIKSVQVVLVSPLRRALQTANLTFGALKVPIIVCPQLTQSFKYSCDLSIPLQHKRSQFPNIDFSRVKGFGMFWQINQILGQKNRQVFHNFYEHNKGKTIQEQHKIICEMVGNNEICETDKQLHDRCCKIKELLKEYKQIYDKIAIVSHWWTLTYLNDEGDFENAKPIWTSLHKLIHLK